jgi:hypothetical protein
MPTTPELITAKAEFSAETPIAAAAAISQKQNDCEEPSWEILSLVGMTGI